MVFFQNRSQLDSCRERERSGQEFLSVSQVHPHTRFMPGTHNKHFQTLKQTFENAARNLMRVETNHIVNRKSIKIQKMLYHS